MANPCFTQIHPTCIPASDDFQSKLTLMSESLRNDGRVWVPAKADDPRSPTRSPTPSATTSSSAATRRSATSSPATSRRVRSSARSTPGRGVGPLKNGVYLDLADSIRRLGKDVIEERYGNLIQMYERITDEDPYKVPMRIYPAIHYTMGGLWVDYNLMSNIPGLYVLGEANFSDHGANRLGASALMQGLADGYFVLPATIGDGLAPLLGTDPVPTDDPVFLEAEAAVADQVQRLLSVNGTKSVDHFHRELGKIMWDNCGMARSAESLDKALGEIPGLREEFWSDVRVLGQERVVQPGAREGRPGRGLPRVRRAARARRPPPRGELRRALPGRAPDRGGRGAPQRRRVRVRRRVGVAGREPGRRSLHKEPLDVRERGARAAQLQVTGETHAWI